MGGAETKSLGSPPGSLLGSLLGSEVPIVDWVTIVKKHISAS